MSDGITVMRRIGVLAMRPAVGWNDAVRIAGNVLVKENHLAGELNDSARRSNPWSTWFTTVEDRIELTLVVG